MPPQARPDRLGKAEDRARGGPEAKSNAKPPLRTGLVAIPADHARSETVIVATSCGRVGGRFEPLPSAVSKTTVCELADLSRGTGAMKPVNGFDYSDVERFIEAPRGPRSAFVIATSYSKLA